MRGNKQIELGEIWDRGTVFVKVLAISGLALKSRA